MVRRHVSEQPGVVRRVGFDTVGVGLDHLDDQLARRDGPDRPYRASAAARPRLVLRHAAPSVGLTSPASLWRAARD